MHTRVFLVLGGGIDMEGNLRGPSKCRTTKAIELFRKETESGMAEKDIKIIASSKWSMNIEFAPKKTIAGAMRDELN